MADAMPTRREVGRTTRRAMEKGQRRFLGLFGPRVTAHGSQLTRAKVDALETLYSHDNELHYLMSGVELLRDETELVAEELEVYRERGLEPHAEAGERLGEDLSATGRRALDKGIVIPDTPCTQAALMGDVLSLEALLREVAASEAAAAADMASFTTACLDAVREVHEDLERVHSVRIKPLRDAHEKAFDAIRAPQKRLERLMEKDEASLEKDKTQRAIAEAEATTQQYQAALRVTTVKLKEAAAAFLMDFTPRVHAVVLSFVRRQGVLFRTMAARNDRVLDHTLSGWQMIKDIRRSAALADAAEEQREEYESVVRMQAQTSGAEY
jgi:hypothetical protein